MEVEEIQKLCARHPGVTEDMKWGDHLCFCVGGKLFLILGLDESPVSASVKVDEEEFEEWSEREGFKPAPYLAKNKWVQMQDIALLSEAEWVERIDVAYRLISAKLTKKLQRELGLI